MLFRKGGTVAILCAGGALVLAAPAHAQSGEVTAAQKALEEVRAENAARLAAAEAEVERQTRLAAARKRLADAEAEAAAARKEISAIPEGATGVTSNTPTPAVSGPVAPVVQQNVAVTPAQAAAAAEIAKKAEAANEAEAENKAAKDFGGISLGAGLSLTFDAGHHDRVVEAELVNNIVRVKHATNRLARLMFETHYFFKPKSPLFGVEEKMWGIGPFVAIQPGKDDVIDAIGLGLMIGFRREPTKTDSFNIGVGYVVDPNSQILGDGILPDQPLPAGETAIRYKETSQSGIMVIASFSF